MLDYDSTSVWEDMGKSRRIYAPKWVRTTVPLEQKEVVWRLAAAGWTVSKICQKLELEGLALDKKTVLKIIEEATKAPAMPLELVRTLDPVVQQWIASKRPEIREKLTSSPSVQEDGLKVLGKVEALERINAEHVILNRTGKELTEGDIETWVKAIFDPVNPPMKVFRIALEILGGQLDAISVIPDWINKGDVWVGSFAVPKNLEKGNAKARLLVHADNKRYFSPEFPVPFEKLRKT